MVTITIFYINIHHLALGHFWGHFNVHNYYDALISRATNQKTYVCLYITLYGN